MKAVKSTIEDVKDVMETIKWIAYPLVKLVQWLIRKLEALIKEELEKLKNAVKQQIALLIVNLLDTISGVDVRNEANRTIGDALKDAHERVEDFEHQTSLQARLLPPGDLADLPQDEVEAVVGPVRDAPGGGWIAQGALPPSHSEIAKDHAPADPGLATHAPGSPIGGAVGGAVHGLGGSPDTQPLDPTASPPGAHVDADEGSVFYGIARALALEADRHVLRQVEAMWAGQGSLYGDAGGLDTSAMQVGHDVFGAEASLRAGAEERRAARDGFKHAQSDAANRDLMARPEVRALLDLVNLIISHPEDSTWWRAVVDRYVDQHPDEVARHIMARNAVRGARTTVAP